MQAGDYDVYRKKNSYVSSVIQVDHQYMVCGCNQETRELLGGNLQLPMDEIGYADEHKQELRAFFAQMDAGENPRIITLIADRENRPRLVDVYGVANEDGYQVTLWDISDMEEEFTYYRDCMWKYRAMIGLTGLVFIDYFMDDDIVSAYRYIGKKSVRIFYGCFAEFAEELRKHARQDEHNLANLEQMIKQVENGQNMVEATIYNGMLHRDHKSQKLHIRACYDDMYGHHMMYAVVSNMTETDEDVPCYLTTAGLDSMTGLLSKRSVVEYTENVFTNPATASRKHYMILLDMDDFKRINDNYGHLVGDQAILLLARTLTDVVKEDGIIGRYGGDEFYILTDRIEDEETLRTMLRLIRGTMETRAREELGIEGVTLSMGISTYPDTGRTYKELFDLADKSLYIAKERGKNRYIIYRPDMHENIDIGANRRGISSYDEQAKAMNKAVRDLFVQGVPAIEAAFPQIVKAFDLDNLDIYYGDGLPKLYSYGKYPSNLDCHVFLENERYAETFDDTGLCVLNNYHNFRKSNPEIYAYLGEKNVLSTIQLALPSIENPKLFASYNLLNRNHKWSDAEISNLSLFTTLVYELLEREKK